MNTTEPPDRDTPNRRQFLALAAAAPLVPALATTDASPTILPMGQPVPILTHSARMNVRGQVVTSIMRIWAPGDVLRCRLCDRCSADRPAGACMLMVDRFVSAGQAPLFDSRGLAVIKDEELGHFDGKGGRP